MMVSATYMFNKCYMKDNVLKNQNVSRICSLQYFEIFVYVTAD